MVTIQQEARVDQQPETGRQHNGIGMISSAELKKSQRDSTIDALRGLLMACVCLSHMGYFLEAAPVAERLLYIFHVPLFLAVSCLFVGVDDFSELRGYIVRRFRSIAVPFVIWAIVYFGLAVVVRQTTHESAVVGGGRLLRALVMGNGHYLRAAMGTALLWFLPCVLTCNVVYAFLRVACRQFWAKAIIVTACYLVALQVASTDLTQQMPWGLGVTAYVLPLCLTLDVFYRRGVFDSLKGFVLFAVLFLLCGWVLVQTRSGRDLQPFLIPRRWVMNVVCDVFSLSVFAVAYGVLKALATVPAFGACTHLFTAVGRHSLSIYVTHQFVFFAAYRVIDPLRLESSGTVLCWFVILGSLAMALFVGMAVSVAIQRASMWYRAAKC